MTTFSFRVLYNEKVDSRSLDNHFKNSNKVEGEITVISLFFKKCLKVEIEIKRKIMYKKAKNLGFTHPQVVNYSQELDELLNKYSA